MLDRRLKQLTARTPVLAASLVAVTSRCGRPTCRCRQDGPRHTAQHLTCKDRGKTRTVYVPTDLIPEVRSWVAQHQRIKQLLHEIHALSVALVRTQVTHRRRRAGRP